MSKVLENAGCQYGRSVPQKPVAFGESCDSLSNLKVILAMALRKLSTIYLH